MLIAVSNGRSYGGSSAVCPTADVNDGLFDVMVLHPLSKFEFLKVFPHVLKAAYDTSSRRDSTQQACSIVADAVAYADGEDRPLP